MASHIIRLVSVVGLINLLIACQSCSGAPATLGEKFESSRIEPTPKLKRDSKAELASLELDTQETGYLGSPDVYQNAGADVDYGYGLANKNSYGKQASDWSLYDQGK